MKDIQVLEIAILAGKVLSEACAEAKRIEDTMLRILQNSNYQHIEVLAQTSNIILSFQDSTGHKKTEMVRIQKHELALDKIHEANKISRVFCNRDMEYEESYLQLTSLLKRSSTIAKEQLFGLWALGPAFALVFKGGFSEVVIVMLLGLIYIGIYRLVWNLNTLLFYLLVSTILSFSSICIQSLCLMFEISSVFDIVMISAIMPMVPGIAITNALRDILNKDYVSGMSKFLESIAQALSIAFGIGIGYALGAFL